MSARTVTGTVATFKEWARAAHGTAVKNHTKGDQYGEQLAEARAVVYSQAAELVTQMGETAEVVEVMMRNAAQVSVRSASLIDFDRDGIRYSEARAWQFCARLIDPALPEVQAEWA